LLAGAYALAGMKEAAYLLIDFRKMEPDAPDPDCYGSYLRDDGIILQTLVALGELEHASKKATEISKKLSSGEWYSTQTTAYSLVSIANFAAKTGAGNEVNYRLSVNGKQMSEKSKGKIKTISIKFDKNGQANLSVENSGTGSLFLNLTNEGVKAGIDTVQSQKGIQLVVRYYDKNWNEVKPETLTQGADFIASVTVTNKTYVSVKNFALAQMFPAGWEIVNTRMLGGDESHKNSEFDYRDYRDDRVYTYFSLDASQSKSFLVNLNASYCGNYTLAPVTCEAMYDNSYFAKVAGKRVKVVK